MKKIIHFEPTSKCNAACPMCARNVNGEGCIVSLGDLSLEHFQIQVTKNIKTLEKVFFCGNVGDPCADVNLLEKISWIKNYSSYFFLDDSGGLIMRKNIGKNISTIKHQI